MQTINANDLKKYGITLCSAEETIVTVRGRPAFVILTIEKYEALIMAELTIALTEAQADYKAGSYIEESVKRHIKRINDF